jgi:hypothetical protein
LAIVEISWKFFATSRNMKVASENVGEGSKYHRPIVEWRCAAPLTCDPRGLPEIAAPFSELT